jgi:hypothetical protein
VSTRPRPKEFRGRISLRRKIHKPRIPARPRVPGVKLDFERAFGLPVKPDRTMIVIPAHGVFGRRKKRESPLLQGPTTLGIVLNCNGDVWKIESEPTGEDRFGFIIYSEKGKPLMVGEGSVPDDNTAFDLSFRTIYRGVSSSPRKDSVSGNAKCNTNNVCEGGVTYTYNF